MTTQQRQFQAFLRGLLNKPTRGGTRNVNFDLTTSFRKFQQEYIAKVNEHRLREARQSAEAIRVATENGVQPLAPIDTPLPLAQPQSQTFRGLERVLMPKPNAPTAVAPTAQPAPSGPLGGTGPIVQFPQGGTLAPEPQRPQGTELFAEPQPADNPLVKQLLLGLSRRQQRQERRQSAITTSQHDIQQPFGALVLDTISGKGKGLTSGLAEHIAAGGSTEDGEWRQKYEELYPEFMRLVVEAAPEFFLAPPLFGGKLFATGTKVGLGLKLLGESEKVRTAIGIPSAFIDDVAAAKAAFAAVPETQVGDAVQLALPLDDAAARLEGRIQQRVLSGQSSDYLSELRQGTEELVQDAGMVGDGKPPPSLAAQGGAASDDSAGAFTEMIYGIPGESAERAAIRKWEGALRTQGMEIQAERMGGVELLRSMKLGRPLGRNQQLTRKEMEPLFKALHGEGPVPEGQEILYDDLRRIILREEQATLKDDMAKIGTFSTNPDYMPRLWQPPRSRTGKVGIGAKAFFEKQRRDVTFTELLEQGAEPLIWNPYDMIAMRRLAGVELRTNKQLVQRLKDWNLLEDADIVQDSLEAGDRVYKDWRVPKNGGPAFEGKAYLRADGELARTKRFAVHPRVANAVESLTAVPSGPLDLNRRFQTFAQGGKRLKLFGSLFQHADFAFRGGAVSYTPTGIRRGAPLRYPSFVARLGRVTFSESARQHITKRILTDPTYRMVMEEGGMFGVDTTIIRRNIRSFVDDIARDANGGISNAAKRRVNAVNNFTESGLFDGVYRESQLYGLDNLILPKLKRLHPTWSERQIAASAAEEMNKMFSTLGDWQVAFNAPWQREVSRAILFSANETESWLRQGVSTFVGKNKQLWQEFGLGYMIFLSLLGNVINIFATGNPMGIAQYLPLTTDASYAFWPTGIGFNTKFMAPQLPFNARNGAPMFLDIVGQADTMFRWVLNPVSSLEARYNVIPRAIKNQVAGSDFYGRPVKNLQDRVRQAGEDMAMPIGPGNVIQAIRPSVEPLQDIFPPSEDRLGVAGAAVQISGLNLRAQSTPDLLDQYARRAGLPTRDARSGELTGPPAETWFELEPAQQKQVREQFPQLQTELDLRRQVAAERQSEGAKSAEERERVNQERIKMEGALVAEKDQGTIDGQAFRDRLAEIQRDAVRSKAAVDERYNKEYQRPDAKEQPMRAALWDYYNAFDNATTESGRFEFDVFEELLDDLEQGWSAAQRKFVLDNIHLADHDPAVKRFYNQRRKYKWYFEIEQAVLGRDPERLQKRRLYTKLPADGRRYMEIDDPWLSNAESDIQAIRQEYRDADDDLARFLLEYSYTNTLPDHLKGLGFEEELAPWMFVRVGQ